MANVLLRHPLGSEPLLEARANPSAVNFTQAL
jgi:hypothetical protein